MSSFAILAHTPVNVQKRLCLGLDSKLCDDYSRHRLKWPLHTGQIDRSSTCTLDICIRTKTHVFCVKLAGYLTVYFTTLYIRYKAGKVTPEMLKIDMRPLWAIGACEAVAQLLFMVSAAHLPGPMLPVINQSYLVWNLLFAALFLGTR